MKKLFWAAILIGGMLLLGTMVTAQEKTAEPAIPQIEGMGSMMGMGMMGHRGQTGKTVQMGSMMQSMMGMMEACSQMMGDVSSTEQKNK